MLDLRKLLTLSLSVIALAAVAAAPAQARPLGHPNTTAKTRTKKSAVRGVSTGKGWNVTPVAGSGVAYVTAGSTGDGPADDAECDHWAGLINDAMAELREDSATSSGDVREDIDTVNGLTDGAMDRGCFIVY